MASGQVHKLGTLWNGSFKLLRPSKPWRVDTEPYTGLGTGNINMYATIEQLEIKDTDPNDEYQIHWIEVNDNGKKYLVSDRVLVVQITYEELDKLNLISGKTVTIDGNMYKLRTITGGTNSSDSQLNNNEWQRWIVNKAGISGLPVPASSDLDSYLNSTDLNSTHNKVWNWVGVYSFAKEKFSSDITECTIRGNISAQHWNSESKWVRSSYIGWRPVLEVLNYAPTITLSTQNNLILTEGSVLSITGSASDADNGDVLTVKYKINSGTVRNIASGVATGTPLSFAKNLTFSNKRLRDGSTEITGDLAENVDHTLTVWAEDDKGGKSAEVTREFRVIHNRPPVISGTNEDLGTIQAMPSKAYTVTEPEKDAFTVTEKINGKVIRSFAGVDGQENTIAIPHDIWIRLQPGVQHTLSIEATDSKGMASVRTYTFIRKETKLEFKLKNPFVTDIAAKRILVTLDAIVPNGATMKIEACNNAFDVSPTWEDITNHVRFNRGFLFTNTEKTADKWGVDIRFVFEKGTATSQVIVNGFGGAFD